MPGFAKSTGMKVLVVEDEAKILDFIVGGLTAQGFTVDACSNGHDALALAGNRPYDALVLDIMIPGPDGLSVLRSLRQGGNNVPVIAVTARSQLDERLEGLNAGADDYLGKPFYVDELIARLHAISRRTLGAQLNVRHAGGLTLNLATREVMLEGFPVDLSTREFNLLEYLMRSPGRVYTRTQILEHVWSYHFDPNTNIVDVYIKRLRQKLSRTDHEPLIETVRGVGYRLSAGSTTK